MKKFINNINLSWFIPEEYQYFWAEYRSSFAEASIYFLVAFSLSLSTAINSTDMNSLETVAFLFFQHLPFFYLFPKLLVYFLDHKARELGYSGEKKILLSFSKYSLVIFLLTIPFTIFCKGLNYSSSGLFILFLSFLSLVYFFNIGRGLSFLYGMERFQSVKMVLSSTLSLVFIPFFFFTYYFSTILSLFL